MCMVTEPGRSPPLRVVLYRQLSQKGWVVSPDRGAGRPCDTRKYLLRLSLKESEMGQSILWPSLSGVVRLHGVWVLAVVCGLFAPIVGPFVCNGSHSVFYLYLLWAET